MAKRRDRKNGSRSKHRNKKHRPRDASGFGGFSVHCMSPEQAERLSAGPAPGWIPVDQQRMTWAGAFASDIDAFEYEVNGAEETSRGAMVIGAAITGELWERCGAVGGWRDLDVDAVLDSLRWLHEQDLDSMHIFLSALITWLANNGRMDPACALAKLHAVRRRESPAVAAKRAAVAAAPAEFHAASEAERLQRVARVRRNRHELN